MHVSLFISELKDGCGPFMSLQWTCFSVTFDLSFFPAFSPRLGGQPKAHHACHLLSAALPLYMVEVVESHVLPGGGQQAQVGMGGVECLLLGPAVPLPCYLSRWEKSTACSVCSHTMNENHKPSWVITFMCGCMWAEYMKTSAWGLCPNTTQLIPSMTGCTCDQSPICNVHSEANGGGTKRKDKHRSDIWCKTSMNSKSSEKWGVIV